MNKKIIKILTLVVFLIPLLFFIISPNLKKVKSAPVTELKDVLSTAQLSYFARIESATTSDSIITINIDEGTNPSNTTYNLFIGDTIAIGDTTAGSDLYIVNDIGNTASISLTGGIGADNSFAGAYVIATRSAIHTVSFKPQTSVSGGDWQILIKATSRSGENSSDGIPDQDGFDLGSLENSDITCPWGGTASVGTTVNITSGISVGSTGPYHLVTCDLAGTNPIGSTGTVVIGNVNKFINPAPGVGHVLGKADDSTADTYTIIVRHTESDGSTIIDGDTTLGKIAVVESVRVTAVVDPTISFYIDNVGTSEPSMTRCGTTLSTEADKTTATSVSFGTLNLNAFNTLAQRFTCNTNGSNGYVVQVYETDQLTNINSGTTIPDTTCDVGSTCTVTTEDEWNTNNTISAFGYSLEDISSSPVAFSHTSVFNAKPFGEGTANAQTIMSTSSVSSSDDQAYICYRITADNYQESGTYQTSINFVATATF